MTAYDPSQWDNLALAQLGASAALLGLVFVGLSINLREVVAQRALVDRALEAVILLATVLFSSTAVLVPGQDRDVLGVELLAIALVVAAVVSRLQRGIEAAAPDSTGPPRSSVVVRRVFGLGTPLLIAIAALTLIGTAGGGLYWWPAAILAAYSGAISNAWVLLIEILR